MHREGAGREASRIVRGSDLGGAVGIDRHISGTGDHSGHRDCGLAGKDGATDAQLPYDTRAGIEGLEPDGVHIPPNA